MNRKMFLLSKGGKKRTTEFKYGLISSTMGWRMTESSFEEDSFDSVSNPQRKWEELERVLLKEKVLAGCS